MDFRLVLVGPNYLSSEQRAMHKLVAGWRKLVEARHGSTVMTRASAEHHQPVCRQQAFSFQRASLIPVHDHDPYVC